MIYDPDETLSIYLLTDVLQVTYGMFEVNYYITANCNWYMEGGFGNQLEEIDEIELSDWFISIIQLFVYTFSPPSYLWNVRS